MSEPMGIYDGRDLIGEIVVSGNRVVATRITPSGKRVSLGTYPNRRSAMAAVSAAHDGATA